MAAPHSKYAIRPLSYYAHLAFAIIVALFALAILFVPEGPNVAKADAWLLVLFFLFTLYGVYKFVAMPQSIEVTADGELKFTSFLGTRIAAPSDLLSVSTTSMGYYVVFRFQTSKAEVLNRIDGLYELMSYLKSKKPDLVIKGL